MHDNNRIELRELSKDQTRIQEKFITMSHSTLKQVLIVPSLFIYFLLLFFFFFFFFFIFIFFFFIAALLNPLQRKLATQNYTSLHSGEIHCTDQFSLSFSLKFEWCEMPYSIQCVSNFSKTSGVIAQRIFV